MIGSRGFEVNTEETTALLAMAEEDLIATLGVDLFAGDHALSAADMDRYKRQTVEWLDARNDALRGVICPRHMRRRLTGDDAADLAVIATAVSGFFLNDHAAYILGAIVLRRGVKAYCSKR